VEELSIVDKIRYYLAGICFNAFLRLSDTTKEEYWHEVYLQEVEHMCKNGIIVVEYPYPEVN